jgi:hypothetical protein
VLDVHHSYNYDGRSAGDLVSVPTVIDLPIAGPSAPSLTLSEALPEPPDPLAQNPEVNAAVKPIDLVSPSLTSFWGREIHMRGWVLLPPGYASHPGDRYPTVYFTHGFGGTLSGLRARYAPILYDRMKQGKMPEMIWVLLDESSPTGTHEFADGVNNGPWGTALTTELIPSLESYISYGRAHLGPLSAGALLRRLGHSLASDTLSQNLRRHLVHFARSQRLSLLLNHRSLRAKRKLLPHRRR